MALVLSTRKAPSASLPPYWQRGNDVETPRTEHFNLEKAGSFHLELVASACLLLFSLVEWTGSIALIFYYWC